MVKREQTPFAATSIRFIKCSFEVLWNMAYPSLAKLLSDQPLRGRIVELHTLKRDDYRELAASCLDPEVWKSTIAKINTADQLRDYLAPAFEQLDEGSAVPFLIRLSNYGTAFGSTRLAASLKENTLEIGWTFIAPAYHRQGINVESKLLLLSYSFDVLGAEKVVFKVASGSERSKAALAKLGAVPSACGYGSDNGSGTTVDWLEMRLADWPSCRHQLEARLRHQ